MSAVNNQVMTCPAIDPASTQTTDFLLKKWTGAGGSSGVMNDSLPVDQTTGLITGTAIATQVQTLINNGTIPPPPVTSNGNTDMDRLMTQDGQLYTNLQSEFCWYESRYIYALNQFLQAATLRQATDAGPANQYLAITQTLNRRANSVLQIISYLAQTRVGNIMSSKSSIDKLNTDINTKIAKLQAGWAVLRTNDAAVTTQKEMVRYTEEKNNYTNNRLVVWTALNILALGAIFYVYQRA
jgi:hypothetical protein